METNFGLRAEWNGRYRWNLFIPGKYRNQICGLCGKWDGNKKNDFTLRDGTVVSFHFPYFLFTCSLYYYIWITLCWIFIAGENFYGRRDTLLWRSPEFLTPGQNIMLATTMSYHDTICYPLLVQYEKIFILFMVWIRIT